MWTATKRRCCMCSTSIASESRKPPALLIRGGGRIIIDCRRRIYWNRSIVGWPEVTGTAIARPRSRKSRNRRKSRRPRTDDEVYGRLDRLPRPLVAVVYLTQSRKQSRDEFHHAAVVDSACPPMHSKISLRRFILRLSGVNGAGPAGSARPAPRHRESRAGCASVADRCVGN
jgi:hypothetical protein